MMRSEFKYIVPVSLIEELRNSLINHVDLDPFISKTGKGEYVCRSIYYDTKDLEAYEEKQSGIKDRKKFRIRAYNNKEEKSIAFLEIKRKYDNLVCKNRSLVYSKDISSLLTNGKLKNYEFPSNNPKYHTDAIKFLYYYKMKSLRPTVLVVYDREAYCMKYDDTIRITFDKNIRCKAYPTEDELFSNDNLKGILFNYFILEIKFYNRFPKLVLPKIIKKFNFSRGTYSKYENSCLFSGVAKN
jgi:SPX domain protein involved in polyphosphate accumulation